MKGSELGSLVGDPDPAIGAAVLLSRRAIYRAGAGDTFCGVLVGLMAYGSGVREALARAGAAATLSVTRPGALPSCPTAAEIAALVVSTSVASPA